MLSKNKKGVSPVVATVLLITIAVVVVIIIFIWAASTINDGKLKFGSPIKTACNNLNVQVTYTNPSLDIINRGSQVPLHSISIKVKDGSSTDPYECDSLDISPGQTATIDITDCGVPLGTTAENIKSIVPILKDDDGENYYCDKNEITDF